VRRYIAAMTLFTAVIAGVRGLVVQRSGRVVDWLAKVEPSRLWTEQRGHLPAAGRDSRRQRSADRPAEPAQAANACRQFRHAVAVELPSQHARPELELLSGRIRGRVAAKLMQTALAVRDTWMILADILVFVLIYFVTITLVVGNFHLWLLVPFMGWLAIYLLAIWYFVPRLVRWPWRRPMRVR